MNSFETWVGRTGGVLAAFVIGIALYGIYRATKETKGRETGHAALMLRTSTYLLIGIPYFLLCYFLWMQLPIALNPTTRAVTLFVGIVFYFPGLILYVWSWFTLNEHYNVSSSLGVRLKTDHELITTGPYGLVRHPMYLGLQVAALGGIFLYRTWTFLFLFVNFLFLVFRARQEEGALDQEFGERWAAYKAKVPAWFPRFDREVS